MKSRRRIAFAQARDQAKFSFQLRTSDQETATSGMGHRLGFALQKSCAAHVCIGSIATGAVSTEVPACLLHLRKRTFNARQRNVAKGQIPTSGNWRCGRDTSNP